MGLISARSRRTRSITRAKSTRTPSGTSTPHALASRTSAAARAQRMSAFDGTQPTLSQLAPMRWRSTSATLARGDKPGVARSEHGQVVGGRPAPGSPSRADGNSPGAVRCGQRGVRERASRAGATPEGRRRTRATSSCSVTSHRGSRSFVVVTAASTSAGSPSSPACRRMLRRASRVT